MGFPGWVGEVGAGFERGGGGAGFCANATGTISPMVTAKAAKMRIRGFTILPGRRKPELTFSPVSRPRPDLAAAQMLALCVQPRNPAECVAECGKDATAIPHKFKGALQMNLAGKQTLRQRYSAEFSTPSGISPFPKRQHACCVPHLISFDHPVGVCYVFRARKFRY
jgi:hypothetical protein